MCIRKVQNDAFGDFQTRHPQNFNQQNFAQRAAEFAGIHPQTGRIPTQAPGLAPPNFGFQAQAGAGFLNHPMSPGPAASQAGLPQPDRAGGVGIGNVFGTGPRAGYSLPGRSVGGSVVGAGSHVGGLGSQVGGAFNPPGHGAQSCLLYTSPSPRD